MAVKVVAAPIHIETSWPAFIGALANTETVAWSVDVQPAADVPVTV